MGTVSLFVEAALVVLSASMLLALRQRPSSSQARRAGWPGGISLFNKFWVPWAPACLRCAGSRLGSGFLRVPVASFPN